MVELHSLQKWYPMHHLISTISETFLLYFLANTIYGLVWYVPEGLKLWIAYFTKIHFTYSWWNNSKYVEGNIWLIVSIGFGAIRQQTITIIWTNDDWDFWCHKVSPALWNTINISGVVVNSLRPSDAIWRHRVNIGSGNGLLPDGTKPLPEPMLTYHQ